MRFQEYTLFHSLLSEFYMSTSLKGTDKHNSLSQMVRKGLRIKMAPFDGFSHRQ